MIWFQTLVTCLSTSQFCFAAPIADNLQHCERYCSRFLRFHFNHVIRPYGTFCMHKGFITARIRDTTSPKERGHGYH